MANAKKDVKLSLKVMVNKEKTKVLFAEIDSSFADVLLSFLTLPLGTIVRILKKHYGDEATAFGSLSSLYIGLENLDNVHFWTEGAKSILLHPRSSSDAQCLRLILDISDSQPLAYHGGSKYYQTFQSKPRKVVKKDTQTAAHCNDGVFTMSTASFVITDDLQILPIATGLLQIVRALGITDMDRAKTMNISFGFSEVMDLLQDSLISSTPLSDIILNKTGQMKYCSIYKALSDQNGNDASASNSIKKMLLKVMVQKSTDKFVYAQAEEDFVEFLFSFLIIPLGGVECLLTRNSLIKSVNSLYKSVADLDDNKYFITPDAKNRLIKPKIPHGYLPKNNHILPLIEEELTSFAHEVNSSLKFPKGQGSYLKAPRTFMVIDDLTVTPLSIASTVSFLEGMNIPISDVKEVELQIGFKEALGILRASLTSTCALSNGLNLSNHLSSLKQPKQENFY